MIDQPLTIIQVIKFQGPIFYFSKKISFVSIQSAKTTFLFGTMNSSFYQSRNELFAKNFISLNLFGQLTRKVSKHSVFSYGNPYLS